MLQSIPASPPMRPDTLVGSEVAGYELEEMIGWGHTSKVYRARHQFTGHVRAVKVIKKTSSHVGCALLVHGVWRPSSSVRSVMHNSVAECSVMGRLKHPNIVELSQWIETEKNVFLIMEFAKNGTHSSPPAAAPGQPYSPPSQAIC